MEEDRITWQLLSYYQSHDFVLDAYNKKHNKTGSAGKIMEINSCFLQGKEYFNSARSAADSVKPLLLYYGAISVAKGVILLKDPAKRECSMTPGHGLQQVNWGQILSGGIKEVLNISVKATSGVFTDFAKTVGNRQHTRWTILTPLTTASCWTDYLQPKFLSDGSGLSLNDIFVRDKNYTSFYQQVLNQGPKSHVGEIVQVDEGFDIFVSPSRTMSLDDARKSFDIQKIDDVSIVPRSMLCDFEHIRIIVRDKDHESARRKLPVSVDFVDHRFFIAESFANGDKLSPLIKLYISSFVLGMLVRYFPSQWMALIRNEKGDISQPLLQISIGHIERELPKLILESTY